MKVSLIVPTLPRNQAYLDLCVQSLIKHTRSFGIELLVAENGEGTNYPQGQCAAVNRVAKRATGEWLMVSNDDMYYAPGWDNDIDFDISLCFSPNLIEPIEQGSAEPFLKLDGGYALEVFRKVDVNTLVRDHKESPVWEAGFNLPFFIRRDVWETIGGYDEFYDPWGSNSDTDLQTKIQLAGVIPMRNRNCLVYHFGSKSETFTPEKQEFWWQNFNYYRDKFGYTRDDEPKGDPWYCKNMINHDKLIFHPEWENTYATR